MAQSRKDGCIEFILANQLFLVLSLVLAGHN